MRTKILALLLLIAMLMLSLASCASGDGGGAAKAPTAGGESDSTSADSETGNQNYPTIPAGQLTAAEWNDAEHYGNWLKLFERGQTSGEDGQFVPYVDENKPWGLPYDDMLAVTVKCGDAPVAGAKVELFGKDSDDNPLLLYTAVSNAKGVAYVFAGGKLPRTLRVTQGEQSQEVALGEAELLSGALMVNLSAASEKLNVIELMFMIDTTGSMHDELRYIKAEVDDVISRVKTANPGVTVRLALLFYRDTGDEYVTRYFDFTEDIEAQREKLNAQKAAGGGDYPEAVHTALEEAVSQQWSSGNTTKLLFHILDAPPHSTAEVGRVYGEAIMTAAEQGIRIIPVASSGVNKETEYLLRSEALLTGGTYTFLTDDSGIGNSHLAPSVGEFTVEFLNSMLVRLISEFYTGQDIEPVDWRQEVK